MLHRNMNTFLNVISIVLAKMCPDVRVRKGLSALHSMSEIIINTDLHVCNRSLPVEWLHGTYRRSGAIEALSG